MDRCQVEERSSTSPQSHVGHWCLQQGAGQVSPHLVVFHSPVWWAGVCLWPSVMAAVTMEPGQFTPPTVTTPTPHPRPNLQPHLFLGPWTATTIRDQSALTQSRVRVSRLLHRAENEPDGYCATTWGAGHPPPPPPLPQNKATPSAPPQAQLTMALSFLTHFPTRGQLVFQ